MPERRERPTVCGYRIIGEVACNDLPQPVSLIWDSLVHSLPQLRLDFLELRPHAVAPGLPLKLESSPSRFAADEGEAQESEGLRSADTAFLVVGRRMAAELNQAGLVRMERQRECLEPLTHRIEEATCVVLMLEAGHQIIGVAHDDHVATGLSPSPAVGPQIEYLVQVDVAEKRGDHRALAGSTVSYGYDSAFEDARLEPFTDQVDDALVANAVFQEADQPILADAAERRGDRLPIAGIFPIR